MPRLHLRIRGVSRNALYKSRLLTYTCNPDTSCVHLYPLVSATASRTLLRTCIRLHVSGTRSSEVVQSCMLMFNCLSMHETVVKRKYKFLTNYVKSDNILCCVCQNIASHELNMLDKL